MKAREFWSDAVTKKSWEMLISLSREYDFIVIGGWAAYLWTGIHKSKDIDIVVDYNTLNLLRKRFNLEKNERLREYEIKVGQFDIDIYLPGYSKLSFPLQHLQDYVRKIKGLKVPSPEVLVVLKQGAEIARRGSVKGKKDLIDILTLLIHSSFSLKEYLKIVRKFSLDGFKEELENEIKNFDPKDAEYVGMNHQEFINWRKKILKQFKELGVEVK